MKRIGMVICLLPVLGGCFFQADPPAGQPEAMAANQVQIPASPQPTPMPPSIPVVEQEVHCDAEANCLAKLQGIASRSGRTLSLKLDNGSTKLFTSSGGCAATREKCENTTLVGYRPSQHLFVLFAGHYERTASIVVSRRTGELFRIEDAVPHFSPDGKRFAVAAINGPDGVNQVAIYSTSAFPPVMEWSQTPKSAATAYDFVGWSGNDQIKLRTFDQSAEAIVGRTSTGWKSVAAE